MNQFKPMIFAKHPLRRHRARPAFTLVELLVVIAIIGVLIGMSVPAMQNMRELSRRSHCQQNLMSVSLAISAYSSNFGHYAIGTVNDSGPIRSEAKGFHHNWLSGLTPMLDEQNIYDSTDRTVSVYNVANDPVRALRMPLLRCPSASEVRDNTTCYAGIAGSTETPIDETNDGVFILNRPIRDRDITDGLGYTMFVGEKLSHRDDDLGWISGTRSSLRVTGQPINAERARIRGAQTAKKAVTALYVGGLASDHPGGAYVLMGSGECEFRSTSTDIELLKQLGARSDGSISSERASRQQLLGLKPAVPATVPAEAESAETGASAETDESATSENGAAEEPAADTAGADESSDE